MRSGRGTHHDPRVCRGLTTGPEDLTEHSGQEDSPNMSETKHFSETEVNGLIPQLEAIFSRLDTLQSEISARANELERVGVQPGGKDDDPSEFVDERRKYNHERVQEYHKEIEKIANLGGILDDVDLKIVDFPTMNQGTRIHLIWQSGQEKIEYFRLPGEDFHKRQRLSSSQ